MKSIEKKGIEKFENNQIKLVSKLIGGTEQGWHTATTKYNIGSTWYDKDNAQDCDCPTN